MTLTMGNLRPVTARTFADALRWDPFRNSGAGLLPGIDVTRTEAGGFRVEIPVPGYKPDEIEVTLEENVLSVTGKSERRQFTRSLLLPEDIDGENIEANVEHGLLALTLAVHPKAQPKKIAVQFAA